MHFSVSIWADEKFITSWFEKLVCFYFRLAKTGKMELIEKFKQSVHYFVSGTGEGFYRGLNQPRGKFR